MNVLFVYSGNKKNKIGILVDNQAKSLARNGVNILHFPIIGKGVMGYLSNIKALRKVVRENNIDVIHAHYSFSGYLAAFIRNKPILTSLMGSDVLGSSFFKKVNNFFTKYFWDAVIIKAEVLDSGIKSRKARIIPNGVDFEDVKISDMTESRRRLNLDINKRYILFVGDPSRESKNYELAQNAYELIKNDNIELVTVFNKPHHEIVEYLNSADVLLLTSKWEGSSNIIKEAMSCNCPIVSTDVGDTRWIIGNTEGCCITSFDTKDTAEKIKAALNFGKRTKGRERIIELGLDSDTIAKKITGIYKEIITH